MQVNKNRLMISIIARIIAIMAWIGLAFYNFSKENFTLGILFVVLIIAHIICINILYRKYKFKEK